MELLSIKREATLAEAFEDYIACRELRPSTRSDYRKRIKVVSAWLDKPMSQITAKMVRDKHAEIKEDRGHRQADAVFSVIRAVINFNSQVSYLEDDIEIKRNPVDILSALKLRQVLGTRIDDYIEDKDIGKWWLAVKRTNNRTASDYLQVLLLCGLRRTEGAMLKWENVDLESGVLLIPASNSKNHLPHKLPLSNYLIALLKERKSCSEGPWLFPSRYSQHENIRNPDKTLSRIVEETGVEFSLHSLRRSFVNIAAHPEVNADEMTLKALLNHRARDVTFRHYVTVHLDRMRPVMERISEFVLKRADEASAKYELSMNRGKPTVIRALPCDLEDMPDELLPANAKVKITPAEQVMVEAKIIWCISEGCRRKKDFYSKIGASFKVNAYELDRILNELEERKIVRASERPGGWIYYLVKAERETVEDKPKIDELVEVELTEITSS